MSKKDYELIARVMREVRPHTSDTVATPFYVWELIREGLAAALTVDNPRFNRNVFMDACFRLVKP